MVGINEGSRLLEANSNENELKKAQEETLQYYSDNSSRFKSELTNEKTIDELKIELYAEKHFFQVRLKQS